MLFNAMPTLSGTIAGILRKPEGSYLIPTLSSTIAGILMFLTLIIAVFLRKRYL